MQLSVVRHQFSMLAKATISGWTKGQGRSADPRTPDLFTVGTDTTSFALEWAIAELLCDPEKLSKTQVELKQIIRKGKPVEEYDIGQLPYLQAIIKDTF
ncbi:hypothetical protein C1H46_005202 [Malus baccata]|uniref:Cytochrome P450 n=1 Tax=Malus baccata TaxID=106549 RepID=A0A540NDZ6_MALBA|nr:hypothetical protein C1H46_005202 [Malus baccata]